VRISPERQEAKLQRAEAEDQTPVAA
jgi:hypothetical protein